MTVVLPVARTENLHLEQLPDELIVYDTYCL